MSSTLLLAIYKYRGTPPGPCVVYYILNYGVHGR